LPFFLIKTLEQVFSFNICRGGIALEQVDRLLIKTLEQVSSFNICRGGIALSKTIDGFINRIVR